MFSDALADELHKGIRRKYPRRRVMVKRIDEIWSADLVEMQEFSSDNDNNRYLLTVIDVLSKFAWAVPLKDKTGSSVVAAFEEIIKSSGRHPQKLWVDKGTEFYNTRMDKFLLSHGIERYSTYSEIKGSVIERFNRTLKSIMWKYFTAKNTQRYLDVLDELLKTYNNRIHSSIKLKPVDASKPENEKSILSTLYRNKPIKKSKPKFKVGDKVRIYKYKWTFEKGYTPNWTEEIFVVDKVQHTSPVTYKIKDTLGEEVEGGMYEQELQKATQELYRVEKELRKRTKNGVKEVLVKWKGYSDKFNSWIPESDLKDT